MGFYGLKPWVYVSTPARLARQAEAERALSEINFCVMWLSNINKYILPFYVIKTIKKFLKQKLCLLFLSQTRLFLLWYGNCPSISLIKLCKRSGAIDLKSFFIKEKYTLYLLP